MGHWDFMSDGSLFQTERLLARRLRPAVALAMVSIFGDPEAMRYVEDGKTLTEADCLHWIVNVTGKNFDVRGYGLIAFVDKADHHLVACGGIFHPRQQPEPEIMYWLRSQDWRKGYGTELVRGLVAHARNSWDVGRIIATIHPDNVASQKVIAKCGFDRIGDRENEDGSMTQVWESPLQNGATSFLL